MNILIKTLRNPTAKLAELDQTERVEVNGKVESMGLRYRRVSLVATGPNFPLLPLALIAMLAADLVDMGDLKQVGEYS